MKIINLKIADNYSVLFDQSFNNVNLIWSKQNTHGKTTLIRFILFALGYDVPSTKKIDMKKYKTIITINNNNDVVIERTNNDIKITCEKKKFKNLYKLPDDKYAIHSLIFGLQNKKIIDNLLGAFYIDQEKGWTLLNRGKVISSTIHFNITDFILGLSNCDTSELDTKIENVTKEINRYDSILNIVKLSEEQQVNYKEDENITNLKNKKSNLMFERDEISDRINELINIVNDNKEFIKTITSYNIAVRNPDNLKKPIRIDGNNIIDYELNQFIINSKIRELKLKKETIEKQIDELSIKLANYSGLINVDELSSVVISRIKSVNVKQNELIHLIEQLKREKNDLKLQKNMIMEKQKNIISSLYNYIKEYGSQLNVFDGYIDKEKNYLFTNNLKEYSGALYHKTTLCYRLAYYSAVRDELGLALPLIIDSPGSAEIKADSLKDMIKLIKNATKNEQIFISSVFEEELELSADKKITLEDGIFGTNK